MTGFVRGTTQTCSSKDIVKDLIHNNVCSYCALRFLNEKNPDAYRNIDITIKKLLGEVETTDLSPASKQRKLNPCSACLGLLQLSQNSDFIKDIAKKVDNECYDSDDVTFALSLPITLLLRDCSVWLHISNKYMSYYLEKCYAGEMKKDFLVVSIKEVWKWITSQKVAKELKKIANNGVNGNFRVNLNMVYEDDKTETSCLLKMYPEVFSNRSSQKRKFHGEVLTRKSVENLLQEANLENFSEQYAVPPNIPNCFVTCSNVECVHDAIYLAGRYNKLSRNLSQTPWILNGEKKMETSVEEIIIEPVSSIVKNDGIKFSSSGREDVDVRMLGKGRPFVLEISNPRKTKFDKATWLELENSINNCTKDVFVRDLQIVKKEELVNIRAGEQTKTKTYSAYCVIPLKDNEDLETLKRELTALSEIKNLDIEQKTPVRVLHRRPLAVRLKIIHWMNVTDYKIEDNYFFYKLELKVSAGTYIKEYVHGDFGRTTPNIAEILKRETDILALDVEEVALDWPPKIDYDAS